MNLALEQAVASRVRDVALLTREGDLLGYYDVVRAAIREPSRVCERCGGAKSDYCAKCSRARCVECAAKGCCGERPMRSEWAEDQRDWDYL